MRVAVVGAGSIGLAVAWRAAQAGAEVVVHDPEPGSGASRVAAGMIAPVTESHHGETALTPFMAASADAWPGFARELEAATGVTVGFRDVPTIVVGVEDADRAELAHQTDLYRRSERSVETLTGRAVRKVEPLLGHRVRSGVLAPEDRAVDPRAVHTALLVAAERAGVRFRRRQVDDLDRIDADQVVIAAGCGSARFAGPHWRLPVRPVRGVVLRLGAAPDQPVPRTTVRGYVKGNAVYIVTREHGEVVVGATSDERGFDHRTGTAGAVHDLLRWSIELVPEIAEYHLDEVSVGFRPGTPDNLPLIGRLDERFIAATGHYRNGIALVPATASTVAALLGGSDAGPIGAFDPLRFTSTTARVHRGYDNSRPSGPAESSETGHDTAVGGAAAAEGTAGGATSTAAATGEAGRAAPADTTVATGEAGRATAGEAAATGGESEERQP